MSSPDTAHDDIAHKYIRCVKVFQQKAETVFFFVSVCHTEQKLAHLKYFSVLESRDELADE